MSLKPYQNQYSPNLCSQQLRSISVHVEQCSKLQSRPEIIFAVILLSFLHAISDDFADVILVDVNGDGHTNHAQEDQGHHDSIGVNHTRIFSASSATSKETDEKHDSSDDDQDHRGVQVGVSKEVQVLVHLDLDVGANADKSHRAEEDHEVEEKDDILDDVVTTTHLEFSVL